MTFIWQRFDIEAPSANPDNLYDHVAASDGAYVLAEDAINREAVNADKIRTLEVQLKEAKARGDREYAIAENRRVMCHEARAIIDEVHSWIVCASITTPEDMAKNFERICEITAPK